MTSRAFALWTGILIGPIAWLISFEINFALAPWACVAQQKMALYVVSLVALVMSAFGGLLAWREWKQLDSALPGEGGGAIPRSRIMALGGMLLSAMFCLVIIAQAVPELMLGACE
jgi:hypothetical protein